MATEGELGSPAYPEYILPHSDFGDPECCGLLLPRERGDVADLTCNECGFVMRTVPIPDLQGVQDQLQAQIGFAIDTCPHCKNENHIPAFSRMLAYICPNCGESVTISEQ